MEIGGADIGASTYATKKAMEMPSLLISLVHQTEDSTKQSLAAKSLTGDQVLDIATVIGKGYSIDLVK